MVSALWCVSCASFHHSEQTPWHSSTFSVWGDGSPFWRTQWPNHFSLCFKSKLKITITRAPALHFPPSSSYRPTTDWLIDWLIGQPGRQHHLLPRSTLRHQALLHSYRRHHAPFSPSSSSICSPPHHTLTPPLHPYSGLSSRPCHLSKYQPLSK